MANQDTLYFGFSSSQHDPAIAVMNSNGELIFAEANERSLKNKRAWNSVPDSLGSVDYVLDAYLDNKNIVAGLSWSDKSLKWSPLILWMIYWMKRFSFLFKNEKTKTAKEYENQVLSQSMYKASNSSRYMLLNLEYRMVENGKKILNKTGFDHHLCHAATACYTSSFEEGICIIVDGMGEGSSIACYSFKNDEIQSLGKNSILNFASLGSYYAAVCWTCGFDPLKGEEWKLMGLAPYGQRDERFYNLLRPMLQVKGNKLGQSKDYRERLNELLLMKNQFTGNLGYANLAFTGQLVFEEILFELVESVFKTYGGENLILSGGCALNSSCNGKLLKNTSFKNLHVPMSPGDDGNAIGAAILAFKKDNPGVKVKRIQTPYLGSEIKDKSIERLLALGKMKGETFENEDILMDVVSNHLIDGKIIGWVQGKAEFGPRSLGHRSILADPRDPGMKDKINALVKFREEFRPFAPSILHEFGNDYFEDYAYSPYMERTFQFSNKTAAPAVVHFDGSGRLQSVTKELNGRFYALISKFHQKTNVPILLNTSFNVMGRPIIHDVEDAIGVFWGSGLDVLVLGNTVIVKD